MGELRHAFEGIKVADFSWVGAGPAVTKCLADHGATVVRLEYAAHPDTLRISGPFKDGLPGLNRSGYFAIFNTNKYSIGLNLRNPKGVEVARRMIAWADVVVENFTPGTLERLGLPYEEMRRLKPNVILLRSSNLGQTGPHAAHPGYGTLLTALAGFTAVTGWPDREPTQPHGAHTDFCGSRLGAVMLVATMIQWLRTGRGQCLDISQFEASLHFLTPLLLHAQTGGSFDRQGNRSPVAAPHSVYRCLGEDRWCAIAVFEEGQWAALCKAMGAPRWTADPRFATLEGRKAHEAELDRHIEEWTSSRAAEEVAADLQAVGVPAGAVQTPPEVLEDPQLRHRGFFWPMEHSELGRHSFQGQPFELSLTPAEPRLPCPCLGEHTELVCREFLGMSDDDFLAHFDAGAFD